MNLEKDEIFWGRKKSILRRLIFFARFLCGQIIFLHIYGIFCAKSIIMVTACDLTLSTYD